MYLHSKFVSTPGGSKSKLVNLLGSEDDLVHVQISDVSRELRPPLTWLPFT